MAPISPAWANHLLPPLSTHTHNQRQTHQHTHTSWEENKTPQGPNSQGALLCHVVGMSKRMKDGNKRSDTLVLKTRACLSVLDVAYVTSHYKSVCATLGAIVNFVNNNGQWRQQSSQYLNSCSLTRVKSRNPSRSTFLASLEITWLPPYRRTSSLHQFKCSLSANEDTADVFSGVFISLKTHVFIFWSILCQQMGL